MENCSVSKSSVVGKVSHEECDEIRRLFGRKSALYDLISMATKEGAENQVLYEKAVADLADVTLRYEKWWSDMAAKYEWPNEFGNNWTINFDSADVSYQQPAGTK